MAIAKSTRSERASAHSITSCPRSGRRPQSRAGGRSLMPSAALDAERFRQLCFIPRLRAIYGTAITAELALRNQSGERDAEVADCLRAGVCDPIADQIRALEEFTGHASETPGIKL
jgi:hypothetical protein